MTTSTTSTSVVPAATTSIPTNLPTGEWTEVTAMPAVSDSVEAAIVALETEAHNQRTLFSTDALRFLANSTAPAERSATLQAVIAKAKTAFPNEDGWLVINLTRLEEILAAK